MKTSFILATFICILIASGCTTIDGSRNQLSSNASTQTEKDKGIVLGSITTEGNDYMAYHIYYRKVGKGRRAAFELMPGSILIPTFKRNVVMEDPIGAIIAKSLDPGTYEIFMHSANYAGTWIGSINEYSLQFEVKEGSIIYIGNFHCETKYDKNILGLQVRDGIDYTIMNKFTRDINFIQDKFPNLEIDKIEINLVPNQSIHAIN